MRLLLSLIFILSATVAQADACVFNSLATFESMNRLLKDIDGFADYCEPCGDEMPFFYSDQEMHWEMKESDGNTYYMLFINNELKDLAYLYGQIKGTYYNLGVLTNCARNNP